MPDIILNPLTKQQLESVGQHAQAILLIAPVGMGKRTIARQLASDILSVKAAHLDNQPFFTTITPVKNAISIEAVRELKAFSKLKTTGRQAIRRVIVIEDAQSLTREAQNAFLKLLEEPPADTLIILTVSQSDLLLPTILSRVQRITIKPVAKDSLLSHFTSQGYQPAAITKAYGLSGGRPGLMHAILEQAQDHPLRNQVQTVKELLTSNPFERLARVDEIAKDKDGLGLFLEGLHRVSQAAFEQAIQKSQPQPVQRWSARLKAIHKALRAYKLNANSKLLLTDLFLAL